MDAGIGTFVPPPAIRRQVTDSVVRAEPPANVQPAPSTYQSTNSLDRRMSSKVDVEQNGTGEIIFRVIDTATGSVTVQTPSESRLRLRAYIDNVVDKGAQKGSFEKSA